jgi:tetratricopeptide (TPR) repeat protein
VRRQADGSLIGRSGSEWKLLLPEGLKSKGAAAAAQLWKDSSIGYRQDRRDKTETAIRLDELYAIAPGADPGPSAATLATDLSWHSLPGVSSADAFRQMIAFLPQAAKNFPIGAPAETIHSFLNGGIHSRLRTWREGDAETSMLEEANVMAEASQAAFASDAGLATLRSEVQEQRTWLARRVAILRALNAGKQADAFLVAYRDFEPFDRSFPELSRARAAHLNASAAAHLETARDLQKRGDYAGAIRHLLIAKWRNPKLAGMDDMLEQVRLEAARISSQRLAAARGTIDPRSPVRVQLQRKLLMVEQLINDRKQEEAEKALSEAEAMDPGEPRLALLYAQLAVSRGELGRALALLDNMPGTH